MRRFPDSLEIFGQTYSVEYKTPLKNNSCGLCYPDKHLIEIDSTQKEKDKTHTLIHEFMHSVIFRTGVFQGVDEKIIEVICESTATAMLENFKVSAR